MIRRRSETRRIAARMEEIAGAGYALGSLLPAPGEWTGKLVTGGAIVYEHPEHAVIRPLSEVDAIDWPWPTFAVTVRPFDWAEDFADLPTPPRQLLGDRRQWDFPLRPPAPVVQP